MRFTKLFLIIVMFLSNVSFARASRLEIMEEGSLIAPAEATVTQTSAPADAKVKEASPSGPLMVRAEDEAGIQPKAPSGTKTMPPPVPVDVAKDYEATRYTLGPEDIIEIIVRRHPEFSGQYPVNAEGKIQYKFVGDIEVKGLTKTELRDLVAKILSKYIITPDVDVTIVEYKSKVIYVIGEVGAPGKYYMRADKISLREAVVQAGLPTLSAAMRRTQLIRPDKSGKPQELKVDLYALLYEGKLNLDQEMLSGDVLVVPATLFAKIMRIVNPVAAPVLTSDNLRRIGTGGI